MPITPPAIEIAEPPHLPRLRRPAWLRQSLRFFRLQTLPLMEAVPAQHRDEVERQMYLIALERARFFSVIAIAVSFSLFYLHDYMQYRAGMWDVTPFYGYGVVWRACTVLIFVSYLVLLALRKPKSAAEVGPGERALAVGFIIALAAVGTSLSILNQMVISDVSVFTLCIFTIAAVFHLPNRIRWGVYVFFLAALLIGMKLIGVAGSGYVPLATNALSSVVITVFIERVSYRYQFRSIADRILVNEKNDSLTVALRQLETTQRDLEREYARKTEELDAARDLQMSMLPTQIPQHDDVEIAVGMKPCTEVGGDYYDFHVASDGTLTLAIGDATGHGLQAGAMVTATKILFTGLAERSDLVEILHRSTELLYRVGLPRLFMALALVRVKEGRVEAAGAGMPPALIHRARSGEVAEVPLKGMPLGAVADFPYVQTSLDLEPGDTIALMSDGLPELFDRDHQMMGYERIAGIFSEVAAQSPADIVAHFEDVAEKWGCNSTRCDDMTFVVLRIKQKRTDGA